MFYLSSLFVRTLHNDLNSFDVDLPLEVDDEYWDSAYDFKQPLGVPSTISAFNQFIKITQIMAFTLRTVASPFAR